MKSKCRTSGQQICFRANNFDTPSNNFPFDFDRIRESKIVPQLYTKDKSLKAYSNIRICRKKYTYAMGHQANG